MIKYIKSFKEWIDEVYNALVLLSWKILEINDRLKDIEKVMPKTEWLTWVSSYWIVWDINYVDTAVQKIKDILIKDFFTKEFLNKEATTTKELYVVDWTKVTIQYYKKDKTPGVHNCGMYEYNWKEYYFVN